MFSCAECRAICLASASPRGHFLCRECGWGWRSAPYIFVRGRVRNHRAFLHGRSDHMRAAPRNLSHLRFAAGRFFVPRMRLGLAQCAIHICSRKGAKPQGISARRDIPPARRALFFAPHRAICLASASSRGHFCTAYPGGIVAVRRMYLLAEGHKAAWHFLSARQITCATRPFIRLAPRILSRPPLLCSETPLCRASALDWAHCAHIYPYKKLREPKPSQS